MPIRRHNKEHLLAADLPQEGFREASNDAKHGISHLSPALVAAVRASLVKKYQEAQVSVARCVNEPLCIAFGTSVSSPTAPTYQLYDLPKTVEARLYCESDDLQCVLRSAAGEWEQAGGTNRSRFLAGLLKDEAMHDDFFVRLPDHDGQRRMRKLRGIIILPAKPPSVLPSPSYRRTTTINSRSSTSTLVLSTLIKRPLGALLQNSLVRRRRLHRRRVHQGGRHHEIQAIFIAATRRWPDYDRESARRPRHPQIPRQPRPQRQERLSWGCVCGGGEQHKPLCPGCACPGDKGTGTSQARQPGTLQAPGTK